MRVEVVAQDFDPGALLAELGVGGAGGIASFLGVVRAQGETGPVQVMDLEHYPGMTEKVLGQIAAEACQRWQLLALTVVHRHGPIEAGGRIMFVGVASAHRAQAFEACEFVVDQLKTRAPFWKRESHPGGTAWVPARASDDLALRRWKFPEESDA